MVGDVRLLCLMWFKHCGVDAALRDREHWPVLVGREGMLVVWGVYCGAEVAICSYLLMFASLSLGLSCYTAQHYGMLETTVLYSVLVHMLLSVS